MFRVLQETIWRRGCIVPFTSNRSQRRVGTSLETSCYSALVLVMGHNLVGASVTMGRASHGVRNPRVLRRVTRFKRIAGDFRSRQGDREAEPHLSIAWGLGFADPRQTAFHLCQKFGPSARRARTIFKAVWHIQHHKLFAGNDGKSYLSI